MNKKTKIFSLITALLFMLTILIGIVLTCLNRNNSDSVAYASTNSSESRWNTDDADDPVYVHAVYEFKEYLDLNLLRNEWFTDGWYSVDFNFIVGYGDYSYLGKNMYFSIPTDKYTVAYSICPVFFR